MGRAKGEKPPVKEDAPSSAQPAKGEKRRNASRVFTLLGSTQRPEAGAPPGG
jgi:hypothetical protein